MLFHCLFQVMFLGEIEEILDNIGVEGEKRFNDFGQKLLSRLVQTAQNMHY